MGFFSKKIESSSSKAKEAEAHASSSSLSTSAAPPPAYSSRNQAAPPSYTPSPSEAWRAAVPDTALFPPPPPFFSTWDRSPANNASADDAAAGRDWCAAHPLLPPQSSAIPSVVGGSLPQLLAPQGFSGSIAPIAQGVFSVDVRNAPDHTLLSYPPLYSPRFGPGCYSGSSSSSSSSLAAYYEVRVLPQNRLIEIGLALGLAALPYPPFRLPGWHRGSLAVHGDDGHRYVNDDAGGITFAEPFVRGGTYGIGIEFGPGSRDGDGNGQARVIFTREGEVVDGWDLYEERDQEVFGATDQGIVGLEGRHELCAAVGAFGTVTYEVILDPAKWLYQR